MANKEEQYAPPVGPPPTYPQQPQQVYQASGAAQDLNYGAAAQGPYQESRGMPFGGQPQQGYYGGQPGYGYGPPQQGMYYQQQPYGAPNGYYGNQRNNGGAAEGCCLGLLGGLCCLDLCLIF